MEKQLTVVELFCGTKSFSKECEKRGYKTFTIDNDPQHNPDLCIDIMEFEIDMLPDEFRNPNVVWASPPCQKFSIMTVYRNWTKKGDKYIPKSDDSIKALQIIEKTLKIIQELNPKYYIIENPMGMLRKQEIMQNLHRDTVTYCQYGLEYQKKTDLWNNLNHMFRPVCSPRSPCHVRAPRGSKYGIQGVNGFRQNREQKHPIDISRENRKNAQVLRGIVPKELCNEILDHIDKLTGFEE